MPFIFTPMESLVITALQEEVIITPSTSIMDQERITNKPDMLVIWVILKMKETAQPLTSKMIYFSCLGHTPLLGDPGDLGNIENEGDSSTFDFEDDLLSLSGTYSIIGRSCVIHETKDDLGLGGTDASKASGNAGSRVALGQL
eukprot:CAMPEP_0170536424 /NCGR_PEP_ID=MMETSP0209-20121228/102143_1 /TAXON_ID=665100 ORGANISM="Litonotus pictus, Strain P1" /NCGR_SAMPLE_ID=MMETSP0209 /ASSEMBLY_ACC=CAM_ASM_000301 /LENGTH=142 /DNA_ID=CAMNT_0010837789 /DNA_START=195 /DNA_END=624 /DNA_ORIENTATION=+